jgi:hypothetical protein
MPEAQDAVHERMSLVQLVQDVIEPHLVHGIRVEAVVNGPSGETAPDIWRRPEIIHAMTSIVENAVDFARSEVIVIARFDARYIVIEARDDGPGFSPEVLAKLGEPYVTTRPGAEGSRTGISAWVWASLSPRPAGTNRRNRGFPQWSPGWRGRFGALASAGAGSSWLYGGLRLKFAEARKYGLLFGLLSIGAGRR